LPTLITDGTNLRRQPSLRSQLNQIRMWVRQGRTDAWIAHKLDVSVDELARFKREHALDGGDEGTRSRPADPLSVPAPEPRSDPFEPPDEDEDEDEEDEDAAERERERLPSRRRSRRSRPRRRVSAAAEDEEEDVEEEEDLAGAAEPDEEEPGRRELDRGEPDEDEPDGVAPRRRRRGRRGGRRHRARRDAYEATFDHGGEGYGLWLDPAVADNPVYSEHWAGHRAVTVTVEAEAITIRRAGARGPGSDAGPGSDEHEEED
jgi:hypothetical protein